MTSSFKMEQDLNSYISMFEHIYEPIQNIERDFNEILARLIESIATCSQYVNKSNEKGLADNLPHVFSWYCSLVLKAGLKENSLSEAVWRKFPNCCPYCLTSPCSCSRKKNDLKTNAAKLEERSKHRDDKPTSLTEWQHMFASIYPRDPQGYDQKSNFAHLIEELGETSEAYRIRYFFPTALESELADVLSWILGMANLLDTRARDGSVHTYEHYDLAEEVFKNYSGRCPECGRIPCSCVSQMARQKISELNVIYPEHIIKSIETASAEIQVAISAQTKELFKQPEAQEFLLSLKSMSAKIEINEENIKAIIDELINRPAHKKWYEKITMSGITESGIVSLLTLFVQSAF